MPRKAENIDLIFKTAYEEDFEELSICVFNIKRERKSVNKNIIIFFKAIRTWLSYWVLAFIVIILYFFLIGELIFLVVFFFSLLMEKIASKVMIISYAEWWLFLLNSSIINQLNNLGR